MAGLRSLDSGRPAKAVIYARYSSDLQSAASIEDQVRLCRQLAEREGCAVIDTYADRAVSGATSGHISYQRPLEDARGGRFDVMLTEGLDRRPAEGCPLPD